MTRILGITYRITVKRNGEPAYNYEPMGGKHIIARSAQLDRKLIESLDRP